MRTWNDQLLDRMRLLGDALADEVVAELFDPDDVDGSRTLLRGLVDEPDPHRVDPVLDDYLERTGAVPDWADRERVARGQDVFERWGVTISVALFCASLPNAYASARGVHVLTQTARLETDTRRRIMETGQFLIDALGPDGFEPDGPGIVAIQRVRLMHAAVRHLILAHQREVAAGDTRPGPPPWQDEWGLPINQEDLLGTLMSFSYTVIGPLPKLGVEIEESDSEDYLYIWRVIGTMLGVRDELIPRTTEESTQVVDLIRERNYAHSADGVAMTRALVALLEEMTPGRMFDSVPVDLIRMLVGDDAAGLLELPPMSRHFGFLTWLKVLVGWSSREVENSRVLQSVSTRVGWLVLNGLHDLNREGEHRASFDIPDRLADNWRREQPTV
jgi:hypothetical protein